MTRQFPPHRQFRIVRRFWQDGADVAIALYECGHVERVVSRHTPDTGRNGCLQCLLEQMAEREGEGNAPAGIP